MCSACMDSAEEVCRSQTSSSTLVREEPCLRVDSQRFNELAVSFHDVHLTASACTTNAPAACMQARQIAIVTYNL